MVFAFAPFSYWAVGVMGLMGLVWLWLYAPKDRPTLYGYGFGLGYFGAGLHWVYISMHAYGDAPLSFAILANIALVLLMAMFPMAVGWLIKRFSRPSSLYRAALIPCLWSISELLRAQVLSGFPWLTLGYSQLDSPLAGFAPIIGVYGISLCLMGCVVAMMLVLVQRRIKAIFPIIAIILLGILGNTLSFTQPEGDTLSIALVQGNIAQEEKFNLDKRAVHFKHYLDLSINRQEQVIIWPETAIVYEEHSIRDTLLAALNTHLNAKSQTLVTGIASERDGAYYNAVITLGAGSGWYAKNHLLPFGEYLPLRPLFGFFKDYVEIPMSDFARGGDAQAPLFTKGIRAGISICFEAAFGEEVRQTGENAHYLINISNDSWFKNSIAADQHLQINQMRAKEMQRPMARVANDGITAFIDAQGRIETTLARFTSAVLSHTLQPLTGQTPYARYGDKLILWIVCAYAVMLGLWRIRRMHDDNSVS